MPSLNIKDEETHRLAHELAKLTGETLTTAVKISVQERIERQRQSSKRQNRMEWLERLTERTAPLLKDLPPSDKIGDLLYDKETGLPL
jgi:antitoxin VapB